MRPWASPSTPSPVTLLQGAPLNHGVPSTFLIWGLLVAVFFYDKFLLISPFRKIS